MCQSNTINKQIQQFKIIIFFIFISLSLSCIRQTNNGDNWSRSIQMQKNVITETTTVNDTEAGWTLFSYFDPPSAQPIMINKIGSNHWIALFEKPNKSPSPKVKIEKISENEFRILLIQEE